MFSVAKLITFSLCAILLASANVKAHGHPRPDMVLGGITYSYAYDAKADMKAHPELQLIKLVGDQGLYNLTSSYSAKHLPSRATCGYNGNPKEQSSLQFYGPCTTSTKDHDQFFMAICKSDPNSKISFNLYHDEGENGHSTFDSDEGQAADATTYGDAKVGFIEDQVDSKLQQSTDKPLTSGDPGVGIILSCVKEAQ